MPKNELRMPDINEYRCAGTLTRDPELRYIASGMAVCTLGLAVNKKFKTKAGEMKEETLFINATVWDKSAEWVGGHMKKGYKVYVEGRLKMNEWEDKKTGQKRTSIEIAANRIQQLTWDNAKGGGQQGGQPPEKRGQREIEEPDVDESNIPF